METTTTQDMHNKGILLHDIDDYLPKGATAASINALQRVTHERPRGAMVELNIYRKHVPILLRYIVEQATLLRDSREENERFRTDSERKRYTRWTPVEENALIDMVCSDNYSAMEVAIILGRSVGAIQTKLSSLVGVKRISAPVVGKFFGKANGVDTMLDLDGTVYYED